MAEAAPAPYPAPTSRSQQLDDFARWMAIEIVLNVLVDDPEALFERSELLGSLDSAYELTRATELALELWPHASHVDDDETPEQLAAEDRAHALAAMILCRLADNSEVLAEHAVRQVEIVGRQPLRIVAPR